MTEAEVMEKLVERLMLESGIQLVLLGVCTAVWPERKRP